MSRFSFDLSDFVLVWWGLLYEAMPFVALGALLSGFVERCLSRETVLRVLPRSRLLGLAASGLLGLVFPMCECGIVPVVRRLVRKGVPVSCAVTYMLAAPIVNPLVLASTFVAFGAQGGWRVAALRGAMGWVVAVTIGLVVWRVLGERSILLGGSAPPDADDAHAHSPGLGGALRDILTHAARDFLEIGATLVVGAGIAALVNSGFHRSAMEPFARSPVTAVGSMSLLAIALNLCSEADAFVAVSFYAFPLPAKMAFLVLGPMLDVKLLAMYTTVFRPRAIVAISGLVFAVIFLLCVSAYRWMPLVMAAGAG